jgi:CRISPR/Cas system-associated exonuclease Cas4 (RecB family)
MVRIARPIDYGRINDLKIKVNDPTYLSHAIQRIAGKLAHEVMDLQGETIDVVEQRKETKQTRR